MSQPPDWVRHVIWWQIYPLGFVGAEDEAHGVQGVQHRLGRVTEWLDHLIELGANGLLLGPINASMSHGYDSLDYLSVDPRLGDDGDLNALVSAAHERGIRVAMDGVFNHVGSDHPWVQEGGPQIRRGENGQPEYFEGHTQLVELDHAREEVREAVAEVMIHWLERGIDGWRLDAAYTVPPDFWAAVLPRVRERFPDAWFVAELIHGPYDVFARETGVDSITEYELWKATWSSLRERNLWELDWTLGRHTEMLQTFLPLNFVGNHDVTRVASQIPDERLRTHAAALLLFLPGVPSIYYGDEFGFEAVKEERLGGDDAIRPEFPERSELAPNATLSAYRTLIGLRRRNPWLVDAEIERHGISETTITITSTARDGGERLVLALNLGEEPIGRPAGEVLESSAPVEGDRLPATAWAVIRPS